VAGLAGVTGADLVVTGGKELSSSGPAPARADVAVVGGRIADPAAAPAGAPTLDAAGLLVAPGFVDLQCNGAAGIDLTAEPERLWELAAVLPRWGVTAWLPTIVTAPSAVRGRALAAWRAGPPPSPDGPRPLAAPLGLHFEGPFLAPERRGAHAADLLAAPDPTLVESEGWAGAVALATLAPELPGATELIHTLVGQGVVVAAGHSSATAAEARAAVDAGVSYVTHLFNAMAPLHHREPALAGVALSDDRLRVGLIADGLHVDPAVVAVAARALGDRLSLVTDAVAALGAPPGPVPLGTLTAEVSAADGGVRLPDGTLAGSTLALDQAVRNLVAFAGVPLAAAVAAVTSVPARVLGLADRGTLTPGAAGDLVLLEDDGTLVATVIGGRVAFDRREGAEPWRS
jgi:N-acetylglucosamine-6-phosphate deacetylase